MVKSCVLLLGILLRLIKLWKRLLTIFCLKKGADEAFQQVASHINVGGSGNPSN